MVTDNRRFKSRLHEVKTISISKRSLSRLDDKRAWISENTSLGYGHKKLKMSTNIVHLN